MPDMPPNLYAALVAFQADMPKVEKAHVARIPNQKDRPYADLSDITSGVMPSLTEYGLAFTSKPTLNAAGRFVLAYKLVHAPSGECEEGEYPIEESGGPQLVGGRITYARRQVLQAVTGVVAELDDDGGAAQAYAERQQPRGGRGSRRGEASPERVERDHAAALAGPGDEDDWPEAARPGSGPPAAHGAHRRRAMMAEFARVKLPDGTSLADDSNRAARIDGINKVIGPDRTVASSNELTPAEVEQVITALKRRNQAGGM